MGKLDALGRVCGRHSNVGDDYIWPQPLRQLHRAVRVAGAANHLDTGLLVEQSTKPFPSHEMVFDDYDPHAVSHQNMMTEACLGLVGGSRRARGGHRELPDLHTVRAKI